MTQPDRTNILKQSLFNVYEALGGSAALPPTDKLAHRLMLTIERRLATLEWLIDSRSKGHVKQRARRVLWWALAEILHMSGVPAPVVVDAATDFVKKHHSASEAGFVNAFLRSLLRDMDANGADSLIAKAPPFVRFNLPIQLWKRWTAHFGVPETEHLANLLMGHAQTYLRHRLWPVDTEPLTDGLIKSPAPDWAPDAELYTPAPSIKSLDSIMTSAQGRFYIQDPATLLAPALLAPKPGEEVADLCCAPGGKAGILAEMMQGQGRLLCADANPARLPRTKLNLAPFNNIVFDCINAATDSFNHACFDAILLDVPCSNTGVIRRKPDVRWSFSDAKLNELTTLQKAILNNAAKALRPGGRLVYSTCSIEPEENTAQIRNFLEDNPDFTLSSSRLIMPSTDNDGAFAALLLKTPHP